MKNKKEYYGIIYKITNLINGKCYIGQTVTTIKSRFSKHFYCSKGKNIRSGISQAINKYGKKN